MRRYRKEMTICLALVAAILAVFGQIVTHDFVNLDDYDYVVDNHHVRPGLTREGVIWALKTGFHWHWHPLTWLSHMTDCELFGVNPAGHHLVSLLFHIANTLLLFLIFFRMTRAHYASAFVAVLFAVHPFHVETVAWVADRKDLLSTFFCFLTIWTYIRYCEKPETTRFALVFLFMVIGVLCKSSIMTLPFALLLLDYWPLSRIQWGQMAPKNDARFPKSSLTDLIVEKIPLFLLAAGAFIGAYITKAASIAGALDSSGLLSDLLTPSRALCSYMTYVVKTLWPHHLAAPYPHPRLSPCAEWEVAGAIVLLAAISGISIWQVRKRPYLIVGWLFFLGNLLPVVGLFRGMGPLKMADRYTYIPLIGLFVMGVFYLKEQVERHRFPRTAATAFSLSLVFALMGSAFLQTRHWKDTFSLFTHAIQVTHNNALAHNNLGIEYTRVKDMEKAMAHFKKTLAIRPTYPDALMNVGVLLELQGKLEEAKTYYIRALEIRPGYAPAHYNLGWALEREGNPEQAESHYRSALESMPHHQQAHNNLGVLMARMGRLHEASKHFQEAVRIQPEDTKALNNLGWVLKKTGKTREAKHYYERVLSIDTDNTNARLNLASILETEGDLTQAESHYQRILAANPESAKAYLGLGRVAELRGELTKALDYYEDALELEENSYAAKSRRQQILEELGRTPRESE